MKSALFTYMQNESTIDFEGHLALVFFTRGCNFRCRYCHNPELIGFGKENMDYETLGGILDRAKANWIDGVCITGGEPTAQENISETAAFIWERGLALKLDTQGSFPERLRETLGYCTYIAMDYKMPLQKYPSLTDVPVDGEKIRRSIDLLKEGAVPFEMRTTVVPGIHTESDMTAICRELEGIRRFVLQPFVPRDNLPDPELRSTGKTTPDMLERFADICRDHFPEVIIR